MIELGRIARLQVQLAPLKRGERPARWYDADRIRRVDALTLTDSGVVGHVRGEAPIIDVHHRDHPRSRYRGDNAISLGLVGHYDLMRQRFGAHLSDGIAGENVIVDHPGRMTLEELRDGLAVRGEAVVTLGGARCLEPCIEFSRFALGTDHGASVREPLRQLRHGIRGFGLGVVAGAGTRVHEGDLVVLQRQPPRR